FWVIHFASEIFDSLAHLSDPDPARRIWHLSIEQVSIFKWLFIKLFNEQTQPLVHRKLAEAAWLKLLLINIERWIAGEVFQELLPDQPDSDVLQLWHIVNDCAGDWSEFTRRISSLQNYDSARHRFKSIFGAPPTQLLFRLRMQKAKNLLLETAMSIKEIAELLGYERQHEFARAFRKHTGMSPTEWRTYPYLEKVPEQIAGKLFSVSFSQ
ncbi:MAG: helix-turn-helix transcriptional regulator, partial [Verrucomicrobia bacterium]|nr:helix-turn-helix transcriptional regulator [Verrucomicrobiota bacterium]